MDKTKMTKKAAELINEQLKQDKAKEEIHLPYSEEQNTILYLANRHLEILKQALDTCVKAEKECFKQYMKNNPGEEIGNCLGRIQDALKPILAEIERCEPIDSDKASKMPKYKSKPAKPSIAEPLLQVKELI